MFMLHSNKTSTAEQIYSTTYTYWQVVEFGNHKRSSNKMSAPVSQVCMNPLPVNLYVSKVVAQLYIEMQTMKAVGYTLPDTP